jgi:hypothetical protein
MTPSRLLRSLPLVLALLCAPLLYAQPLVDGISVGVGLSSYHGDLDWNPDNGPAEFLAAGNLGAFVAADRSFGPIVAETALHFNRVAIDFPDAEMALNVLSLDLNAGPTINLFRPGFLRLYAGVSPSLVFSNFENLDVVELGAYNVDQASARFLLTFPVGIIIQDTLRLGIRITTTDYFENVSGNTDNVDLLSFISVGYRVDLLSGFSSR